SGNVANALVNLGLITSPTIVATTNADMTGDVTSVGNLTTYNNIVPAAKGGTGVDNSGKIITLDGNLTTSGANDLILTTTAATNVTLPTSGTLVSTDVTDMVYLRNVGTSATGDVFIGNATGG